MNDTSLSKRDSISILSAYLKPLKNILQILQWTIHITDQSIFPYNFLDNLCQLWLSYCLLTLEISPLFSSIDSDIDFNALS